MRAVLEHLTADDEIGIVGFGQSNRLPTGDRDSEGFVAAPHLQLRAAGTDLTILSIAPAVTGGTHGAAASESVVTVAEALVTSEWVGGELRLVQHDYGDAVASSLRRGHARVLGNRAGASNHTNLGAGGALLIDTNDRFLWQSHGLKDGSRVVPSTTGTLPGLTPGVVYFVRDATPHTFRVSLAPDSAAITLTGGSGFHTLTALPFLHVAWVSAFQAVAAGVTFSIGTPGIVNHTAHGRTNGSTVSYDANVPPELTVGVKYFVVDATTNAYSVSATFGGAALAFSGAGGTANATPHLFAFVSGYVHLHDRFNSYDNVQVVTPFQPIAPGDYPAGVPVVPGYSLPSDVTSHADAALVLPYAWNEGVDGHGAAGTAQVSGLVVTFEGGQTVGDQLFAGGFIRVGGAKGKVASNTTTAVTVESWTPSAGPGAGVLPFVLYLPHWRNNPHHHTAGEGFLYPSGNMQPGGGLATSLGFTYSRPRGRLQGSYVNRTMVNATAGTGTNAAGLAQCRTNASGQLTAAIVGGKLRLQRATTASDPATGLIQFEAFLRPGYTVALAGMGQTPSVDAQWRVDTVQHATAAAGSYVDLVPLDVTLMAVPGSVSGTVPTAATVTHQVPKRLFLFGSLIESCWRLAVALGRRIVVAHLGVNSSSQIASSTNSQFGFQGQLGWWNDDDALDWTPSNPDGLAARLRRLVEFIAPRAVRATFGATRRWKVLAIDAWQAEADALTGAGQQLAQRSIPTFVRWLRSVITGAGLSPYPAEARVPVQWARLPMVPWELVDTDGMVNAAIDRMVAFDGGFAVSIPTDTAPKLSADPLHFNGVGEAQNGLAVAEAVLPMIEFAFQFTLGPGAIDVANKALAILGASPNVTALEPPNATVEARQCAVFLPEVRDWLLQSHAWTFATRRVAPKPVTAPVSTWAYVYAVPADLLYPTAVLDPTSTDDLQVRAILTSDPYRRPPTSTWLANASQPMRIETDQEGNRLLRTSQENATLIYIARNVPFELWDPLVLRAAGYALAHCLAGGIIKGKTGAAVGERHLQMALALLQQAAAQNAEWQQDVRPEVRCPWLP